jgi:glutaredoxin 3
MSHKREIKIFSAGCPVCEEAINLVNQIACTSSDVEVLDMRQPKVAERARQYGVRGGPSVVINGELADCCASPPIVCGCG